MKQLIDNRVYRLLFNNGDGPTTQLTVIPCGSLSFPLPATLEHVIGHVPRVGRKVLVALVTDRRGEFVVIVNWGVSFHQQQILVERLEIFVVRFDEEEAFEPAGHFGFSVASKVKVEYYYRGSDRYAHQQCVEHEVNCYDGKVRGCFRGVVRYDQSVHEKGQ